MWVKQCNARLPHQAAAASAIWKGSGCGQGGNGNGRRRCLACSCRRRHTKAEGHTWRWLCGVTCNQYHHGLHLFFQKEPFCLILYQIKRFLEKKLVWKGILPSACMLARWHRC